MINKYKIHYVSHIHYARDFGVSVDRHSTVYAQNIEDYPKPDAERFIYSLHPLWNILLLNKAYDIPYLNSAMMTKVEPKYGTTPCVFFSSSMSSVREAKRAVEMYLNMPESSAAPTAARNASSHTAPLKHSTIFIQGVLKVPFNF